MIPAARSAASAVRGFATSAPTTAAPDLSRFKQIAVIGAGQMGVGIAYVSAAVAKREVLLLDNNPAQVEKGIQFIGMQSDSSRHAIHTGQNLPQTRHFRLRWISHLMVPQPAQISAM